jgi:hypothetical protein
MKQALACLDRGDPAELEIRVNWATVLFRMKEYKRAKDQLAAVCRRRDCPDDILRRVRDLLAAIQKETTRP